MLVTRRLIDTFKAYVRRTDIVRLPAILLFSLAVSGQAQTVDEAANQQEADVGTSQAETEAAQAEAETEQTQTDAEQQEAIEEDIDGSLDDAKGSAEVTEEQRGLSLKWDVRGGYSGSDTKERDDSETKDDLWRARYRFTGTVGLFPYLRAEVRMAGLCSEVECEPNFVLTDYLPTNTSMEDGDVTLDKAFLNWYRLEKFSIVAGRMQTKFVALGGVYAKSLDRNTGNNTNVNWTDGAHFVYKADNGWASHLIAQHNAPEGATEVRRGPLDFKDDNARVSYFFALDNKERTPYFLQRGLDISYLPSALLKDGALTGRREDYYGIVVRSSNRWPRRDDDVRLRVAAEIGYAPETQTRAAAGLAGDGDADGLAWNIVLSLMDFAPDHSIGVNYGEVGAGWLLSPQFRQNESLSEIRYQWRRSRGLALDVRVRRRTELEQLVSSTRKQDELDFFVRLTLGGVIW
ncbi:MAG: hypothetical protein JSU95_07595 [Betaproteobacteria bacterium]|nr:MAG: hypothetical protein JSU95_07595 [Betaproteobacteria bacterium]